ncbi:unnamed protein product [Adineta steineri]|uniref:Endonuclease/exonuclease/phosphatase domain-containing protein n=2 Tax=Adineta steineri TaxID=433720 RepID=A0A819MJM4_9BILA|nr:unnamed protein product [Adineta steineri]CAF3980967.1 unnamed protein product [Adineta steineri]
MSVLRLATINVHSFRNPKNYDSNVIDLVSLLQPLNLDLIATEEIQNNNHWTNFCRNLGFEHFIHGQCGQDYFANGIASRHPIKFHSNQSDSFSYSGGTRALLQCRLDGFDNLTFGVTHLDHLAEDPRLKQIEYFKPHKQNIDILIGDMNALTRDDYSDDYFSKTVFGQRKKSGWEKPRFDLTHLITHEWDYQDAFKLKNPKIKDEQLATCAYGTRIDYIFVHPRVNERWNLTECSIIDTKGVTDHNGVLAEFKLK